MMNLQSELADRGLSLAQDSHVIEVSCPSCGTVGIFTYQTPDVLIIALTASHVCAGRVM